MEFKPEHIYHGLINIDRKILCTFLALYEDGEVLKMLGSLIKEKLPKLTEWIPGTPFSDEDLGLKPLQERIAVTSQALLDSPLHDDYLRLRLWARLREGFDLPACLSFSHRGIPNCCEDIALAATRSFRPQDEAEQSWADRMVGIKNAFQEAWDADGSLLDRAVALKSQVFPEQKPPPSFNELVRLSAFNLIQSAVKDEKLDAEAKARLADALRQSLNQLDDDKKSHLHDLLQGKMSDDELLKWLAGAGGGLIAFGIMVELAGFSAYILAAQASAFIPLIGGQTLVSLVAVIANPVFIIAVIVSIGLYGFKSLSRGVRQAISVQVTTLLALSGVDQAQKPDAVLFAPFFLLKRVTDRGLTLGQDGRQLEPLPDGRAYEKLHDTLAPDLDALPKPNQAIQNRLASPALADDAQDADILASLLFPDEKKDNQWLAALTLGDLLFNLAVIDPKVILAADFYRSDQISDEVSFAYFADQLSGQSAASLAGSLNQLEGYVAEQVVATRLIEQGHDVSLPDSASQPGFDLLVDGQPFQVKCLSDVQGISDHFEKYPDIPVFANAELAEAVSNSGADWASQVYFIDGYSQDFVESLTATAVDAGADILSNDIPLFATGIAAARNLHGWWKGQQTLDQAVFQTALEGSTKGVLGIVGGYSGQMLGLLLLGPAGGVIGIYAGGLIGAGSSSYVQRKLDQNLHPDYDKELTDAVHQLLAALSVQLDRKIDSLRQKAEAFTGGDIGHFLYGRFADWLQFCRECKDECKRLESSSFSGQEMAFKALKLTRRCKIHPALLQAEIKRVVDLLSDPPTLADAATDWLSGLGRFFSTK